MRWQAVVKERIKLCNLLNDTEKSAIALRTYNFIVTSKWHTPLCEKFDDGYYSTKNIDPILLSFLD